MLKHYLRTVQGRPKSTPRFEPTPSSVLCNFHCHDVATGTLIHFDTEWVMAGGLWKAKWSTSIFRAGWSADSWRLIRWNTTIILRTECRLKDWWVGGGRAISKWSTSIWIFRAGWAADPWRLIIWCDETPSPYELPTQRLMGVCGVMKQHHTGASPGYRSQPWLERKSLMYRSPAGSISITVRGVVPRRSFTVMVTSASFSMSRGTTMVPRRSSIPGWVRFPMMSMSVGFSWMCTAIIWSSGSMVRGWVRCRGCFSGGSGGSSWRSGLDRRRFWRIFGNWRCSTTGIGIGALVINCGNTGWVEAT